MGLFSMSVQWKGVEDGLFGHVQGFMAQMITMGEVIYGMSWLVFSNTRMFIGVVLGILTLFVFQVNGGVVLVLLQLWKSFLSLLRI